MLYCYFMIKAKWVCKTAITVTLCVVVSWYAKRLDACGRKRFTKDARNRCHEFSKSKCVCFFPTDTSTDENIFIHFPLQLYWNVFVHLSWIGL